MNQRYITQIQDSPYHAIRGYSRKLKPNDGGRRIVTENEVNQSKTPSSKQPRFTNRKSTTNHSFQEDFKQEPNSINNFNNIHINIHHNEFINKQKYFPTLKGKLMGQTPVVPHRYSKVLTQPEELVSRTPITNLQPKPYRDSSSMHENSQDNRDYRSASSHVQTNVAKKRLHTNESFDGVTPVVDSKNYQNMIISQIRDRKEIITTTKNKSIDDKRQRLSQSTKNENVKKGNFMIDFKQPSLLDQSIEIIDHPKLTQVPNTTTNASNATRMLKTSQQRQSQQSSTQKNQPVIVQKFQNFQVQEQHNKNSDKQLNNSALSGQKTKQKQISQEKKPDQLNETVTPQQILLQQPTKRTHPKVQWDMSDEEWTMFGDRFPIQFDKKKLLGRGGFSLVWLGEHRKTKEKFAIKQILSNNTHQSHMKEIWFGTYFFDNGIPKEKFSHFPGSKNLVRFLAYDVKPQDTWIFYEICGESLGNHLYDLRGENHGQERIYRIYHKPIYQTLRKDNSLIKKILSELAMALELLSEQRIVHSDLKTENILVKVEKNQNGLYQLQQIKLIDYGSSFPFDDLKQFSMATPEYMCPEILNYILYENSLNYHQSLLKYLVKYQKPWVIDVWSLGSVILEIISGIPLWMSLKTLVTVKGKESIEYGLFAVKGRVFEKIIERQIEVVSNLDHYLDNQSFSGIQVDNDIRYLLKRMLALNPDKRISPREIVEYLENKKEILHTQ